MSAEREGEKLLLENLPTDVLLIIFYYCDDVSLGRLSQQCRRFNDIISDDFLWLERSKRTIVTNQMSKEVQDRSYCMLTLREKCRISTNWKRGKFKENVYLSQKTRYMPWLSLNSNYLWVSKGRTILSYQRKHDGIFCSHPVHKLVGHGDDVCRFVETENVIISGGRDGALCGWSSDSGELVLCKRDCHMSDINAVSIINDTLISGSRDKTIKFWRWQQDPYFDPLRTINVRDRVWCTSANPKGNLCAIGSSGYHQVPPLHLYDLESGHEVMSLNGSYMSGAGVLDAIWESPYLLLSTGYDAYIRLWDTRIGRNVISWEDPYDSAIYCLASDNLFTILCGTAQHGRVQLWDKRQKRSVQMYFMAANHSSPVYSLAFDPCHLFVALDQSINNMDFSGIKNNTNDMNHHLSRCK